MTRVYVALLVLALACPLSAATVIVNGTANVFGAGHSVPPNPGGPFSDTLNFTGTSPVLYTLLAGLPVVQFPSVTGIVGCCTDRPSNGPDGGNAFPLTNVASLAGVAGVQAPTVMFLAGVFLNNTEPSGLAPSRLDFTGIGGTDFSALAPALNQVFYIGDGLRTDGITQQQFIAPSGATRLYLGFVDTMGFVGPPGAYADNSGFLTVNIAQYEGAPEPASILLLVSGAVALIAARKFRKPNLD